MPDQKLISCNQLEAVAPANRADFCSLPVFQVENKILPALVASTNNRQRMIYKFGVLCNGSLAGKTKVLFYHGFDRIMGLANLQRYRQHLFSTLLFSVLKGCGQHIVYDRKLMHLQRSSMKNIRVPLKIIISSNFLKEPPQRHVRGNNAP